MVNCIKYQLLSLARSRIIRVSFKLAKIFEWKCKGNWKSQTREQGGVRLAPYVK